MNTIATTPMEHFEQKMVVTKKAALVLRAINHKLRRQIITLIHENKRMTVSAIYQKLLLEQSVASQHLAILRQAGFVLTEREGKHIFYTLNYQKLKQVHSIAEELLMTR